MWLDYFSGAVPTSEFFPMTLDDLSEIVSAATDRAGSNRLTEGCFISLVSYFEAFCKDHFASILNIEPRLLENLKRQGQDITIDPSHLLSFDQEWSCRLGFLIAEKYDLGTARKTNALYGALLKIWC
jgi:hypothetical protein